jgi:hypothetical protein
VPLVDAEVVHRGHHPLEPNPRVAAAPGVLERPVHGEDTDDPVACGDLGHGVVGKDTREIDGAP